MLTATLGIGMIPKKSWFQCLRMDGKAKSSLRVFQEFYKIQCLSSGSKNWQQFFGIPHFWTKPCAFPWQVSPNAFNYSALISSCGRAGQWQLAWELYQELFGLATCEGRLNNPIVLKANACKSCKSLSFNLTKLPFSTEGSRISECKMGGFLWFWDPRRSSRQDSS